MSLEQATDSKAAAAAGGVHKKNGLYHNPCSVSLPSLPSPTLSGTSPQNMSPILNDDKTERLPCLLPQGGHFYYPLWNRMGGSVTDLCTIPQDEVLPPMQSYDRRPLYAGWDDDDDEDY